MRVSGELVAMSVPFFTADKCKLECEFLPYRDFQLIKPPEE